MGRNGGNDNSLHPRLTVVPVGADGWAETVAALRARARIVDRDEIVSLVRDACERRTTREEAVVAELDERRHTLEARRSAAERVLADLTDEQQRTRGAADWCDQQPEFDAEDTSRVASSSETLDEHSRLVREANRRLERVLEQRAAAEAAIDDAREHLEGLEVAGFDETGVRRQIEDASHELRAASGEYQQRMKDVARHEATVARLEEALGTTAPREPGQHHDHFRSMRAAIDAKLVAAAAEPGGAPPSEADLDEARAALREEQTAADASVERLSRARKRVSALEAELEVRSDGGTSPQARYEAALELEAQVASVESRLAEAEVEARAEVEEATRSMTRAELTLDRLRQRIRDRHRHLVAYARILTDDQRADVESDPVSHARTIARALRGHADDMDSDREHASEAFEREREAHEAVLAELQRRRAALGEVTSEDRLDTIRSLEGHDRPVALDAVVTIDGGEDTLSATDLDDAELSSPLIVLTDDPAVVSWAIELPADRGCVMSAVALRGASSVLPATSTATDTPTEHRSIR